MSIQRFNNPLLIKPLRGLPTEVGVIGAGTIGPDIAYYLKSAIPGLKLKLIDIDDQVLNRATDRICSYAKKGLDRGKLSAAQAADVQKNVVASTDYSILADCDWVIEAATENLLVKKKIFADVEAVVSKDALITSNTSSIPANRLFSHLEHPERTTVTHFFAPTFRNPVVEVVDWEMVDSSVIDYLRWLFCMTDKVPMLTRDVVCFMLDRIFDNWCNEAALLLDRASPGEVDCVAGEFVHAGPFYVLNLAKGNPIIVETNTLQMEVEGEHYRPAAVFDTAGKWDTIKPGTSVTVSTDIAESIRDRLLGILFSQTFDILDRDIGKPEDLDLGCRLAFAFKDGPLKLANRYGRAEVARIIDRFVDERPGMPKPRNDMTSYESFYRYILVDNVDGVRVITLRRPDVLNALNDDMTDEILSVLKRYESDPDAIGFVITGYGTKAFCAGADIGRFADLLGKHQESVEYARACSRLLVYLDSCSLPVVAALNGMALGGGLELAIRCDHIVATKNAWMQLPEITLGIVPGIGAMVVPYRRWPQAAETFNKMLLNAAKLDSSSAKDLGIVSSLVDKHTELLPTAIELVLSQQRDVRQISDDPVSVDPAPVIDTQPATVGGQLLSTEVSEILRDAILESAAAPGLEAALEAGYHAFARSAATSAANEGISAFLDRRLPNFQDTG